MTLLIKGNFGYFKSKKNYSSLCRCVYVTRHPSDKLDYVFGITENFEWTSLSTFDVRFTMSRLKIFPYKFFFLFLLLSYKVTLETYSHPLPTELSSRDPISGFPTWSVFTQTQRRLSLVTTIGEVILWSLLYKSFYL